MQRIMIVEDERLIALDIQDKLEELGYETTEIVTFGEEVVEKAAKLKPDLILMDIKLEGDMDGIDASVALRHVMDIPIIYLTSFSNNKTLKRAKITEPYGYLLKPFEDRDLATTIEIALYKHSMEKKIRDNESWLTALMKSITDAIIVTDSSGIITYINSATTDLLSLTESELLNSDIREIIKITKDNYKNSINEAIDSVNLTLQTYPFIGNSVLSIPKGGTRYIEGSATPLLNKTINENINEILNEKSKIKNEQSGIVFAIRDVTRRKLAEQALQESRELYHTLARNFHNGSVNLFNRDLRFVLAEGTEYNRLGINNNALIGRKVKDFFGDTIGEVVDKLLSESFEGRIATKEFEFKNFTYKVTTVPVRYDHDTISYVMEIIENITERKNNEIELKEHKENLEKLVEIRTRRLHEAFLQLEQEIEIRREAEKKVRESELLKTIILQNIGHELRTPLNGIIGFTHILKGGIEKKEHTDILDLIIISSNRLERTLNSMLTLSELEANTLKLCIEKVYLESIIKTFAYTIEDIITKKGLQLEINIKDPLISCYADEYILNQILYNITDNAIKYTSSGKIIIETDVLTLDKTWGIIRIIDTGCGISSNNLETVFEAFRQDSEGIRRNFEGVGLGLTITRKMLELLNGSMKIESTVDVGSVVTLMLELAE